MKNLFSYLIVSCIYCFPVLAQDKAVNSQVSGVKTDNLNIQKTLDFYLRGLQEGNLELLKKAFLPEGSFCFLTSDNQIKCETFNEILPSWAKIPDANATGVLLFQEVKPTMARVTYELKFGGKTYLDFLLLYKVKDEWVIVSKTTEVQK